MEGAKWLGGSGSAVYTADPIHRLSELLFVYPIPGRPKFDRGKIGVEEECAGIKPYDTTHQSVQSPWPSPKAQYCILSLVICSILGSVLEPSVNKKKYVDTWKNRFKVPLGFFHCS